MRLPLAPLAFLRKDFLEESSYRLQFLLGLGFVLAHLVFVMLLSDFIGPLVEEREGLAGGYFGFVILGLCVLEFLDTAIQQLARTLRRAQTLGTLEALLATRTALPTLILCLPLFDFARCATRTLAFLVLGWLFFDLPFRPEGLLAGFVAFTVTACAFSSMGVATAALTIAFKRTDFVNSAITLASIFLGGVWYPPEVLPRWLQRAAEALPITPALEAIRASLLEGRGLAAVWPQIAHVALLGLAILPPAAWLFRWSVHRAMRDGTLTQY